jgi:hypothetical protein
MAAILPMFQPELQEDLHCKLRGAAAIDELGRPMEVDVEAGRQLDGRHGVESGPHQLIGPPALDAILFRLDNFFYRRHFSIPSAGAFPHYFGKKRVSVQPL